MASPVTRHVEQIIGAPVADIGYEIVRVSLSGGARRVLQVMVERADREEMTVDDCAAVSRLVSTLLDVEDPIDGAYSLEVSLPRDRPTADPTRRFRALRRFRGADRTGRAAGWPSPPARQAAGDRRDRNRQAGRRRYMPPGASRRDQDGAPGADRRTDCRRAAARRRNTEPDGVNHGHGSHLPSQDGTASGCRRAGAGEGHRPGRGPGRHRTGRSRTPDGQSTARISISGPPSIARPGRSRCSATSRWWTRSKTRTST